MVIFSFHMYIIAHLVNNVTIRYYKYVPRNVANSTANNGAVLVTNMPGICLVTNHVHLFSSQLYNAKITKY